MRFMLLLTLVLGCGVTPTEGDKKLNDQNKKAGSFIKENAADPEVKAAGADVESNSATLEKNLALTPKDPSKPYSKEESAKARKESTEEHSTPWWKGLLIGLGGVLGSPVVLWGLRFFFPAFMSGPMGGVATATSEAIARLREKANANGGNVSMTELLELAKKLQQEQGVQTLARDLAHRLETRLATRQ